MTVDKDKLRQLAEAATPGPWFASPSHDHYKVLQDNDSGLLPEIAGVDERVDVAFIAAANPATVLALLDELAACKAGAEMMVARVQEESTSWRLTCKVYEKANRALDEQLAAMTKAIERIDETLRVPAAEYVPAIGDVFTIIDQIKKGRHP